MPIWILVDFGFLNWGSVSHLILGDEYKNILKSQYTVQVKFLYVFTTTFSKAESKHMTCDMDFGMLDLCGQDVHQSNKRVFASFAQSKVKIKFLG